MKKGIIKITDSLYKDYWDVICQIFKDFKPSHIEFRHWENDIWYFYGTSDFFENLKEAEQIPFYSVKFTIGENEKVSYEFEKEK